MCTYMAGRVLAWVWEGASVECICGAKMVSMYR